MKTIPQIAVMPGVALYNRVLSSDAKILLGIIMTESSNEGCDLTNPALAGRIGCTVAVIRKRIAELVDGGWMTSEENGKKRNLIVLMKQEEVMPISSPIKSDLFDKRNLVIDDKKVVRLISVFIDQGINPAINCKAAISRFYANPYNRWGAQKLIEGNSMKDIETVLEELGKRKKEKFCPKPKSFYTLYENWEKAQMFTGKSRGKIDVI